MLPERTVSHLILRPRTRPAPAACWSLSAPQGCLSHLRDTYSHHILCNPPLVSMQEAVPGGRHLRRWGVFWPDTCFVLEPGGPQPFIGICPDLTQGYPALASAWWPTLEIEPNMHSPEDSAKSGLQSESSVKLAACSATVLMRPRLVLSHTEGVWSAGSRLGEPVWSVVCLPGNWRAFKIEGWSLFSPRRLYAD